jgi:hypothetical protein
MNPLKKETLEQATQRLREKLSLEKLRRIPKFEKLTPEKHKEMLNFIERIASLLLDSYIRNNKQNL